MQVELVSPERITYSGEANKVLVRTVGGGDIEFLPGHVPFIGVLQVSAAKIMDGDNQEIFAIHQGFVYRVWSNHTVIFNYLKIVIIALDNVMVRITMNVCNYIYTLGLID